MGSHGRRPLILPMSVDAVTLLVQLDGDASMKEGRSLSQSNILALFDAIWSPVDDVMCYR